MTVSVWPWPVFRIRIRIKMAARIPIRMDRCGSRSGLLLITVEQYRYGTSLKFPYVHNHLTVNLSYHLNLALKCKNTKNSLH